MLLLNYYDDGGHSDDEYTNPTFTFFSFYTCTHHFPSPSPSCIVYYTVQDTLATDTRGKSNRYEMHLKLQECVSHPKVFGVFIHATNMHAASSCGSIGNGEKNVNTSTDIRPISIGSSSITVYDGANEITRTFADGDTLAAKGLGK